MMIRAKGHCVGYTVTKEGTMKVTGGASSPVRDKEAALSVGHRPIVALKDYRVA